MEGIKLATGPGNPSTSRFHPLPIPSPGSGSPLPLHRPRGPPPSPTQGLLSDRRHSSPTVSGLSYSRGAPQRPRPRQIPTGAVHPDGHGPPRWARSTPTTTDGVPVLHHGGQHLEDLLEDLVSYICKIWRSPSRAFSLIFLYLDLFF
jgi:hypothetical protein